MNKIGIYSGSFDPIHEGHVEFAQKAIKTCGLDKVYFLVEPSPRNKQGVKAFEHRAEMTRLAIKNEPKMGLLLVDQPRFTTTETLPVLAERFKGAELYMLIGDDVLGHFAGAGWPDVDQLIKGVTFAVGLRRMSNEEAKSRLEIISKTTGIDMNYKIFEVGASDVSSSKIKKAYKDGKAPKGLPEEVHQYIKEHNLYRNFRT